MRWNDMKIRVWSNIEGKYLNEWAITSRNGFTLSQIQVDLDKPYDTFEPDVDDFVIQTWTGEKDSSGNPIFEEDILHILDPDTGISIVRYVIIHKGEFTFHNGSEVKAPLSRFVGKSYILKVIGNLRTHKFPIEEG